jgi:Fe-S-cluster containining protein
MTEQPRFTEESSAFYAGTGLRFGCRRCSACCRFTPGFVLLSPIDLVDLMAAVAVSWEEFKRRFLRPLRIGPFIRLSLREKANYDCIFWENDGCRVYDHRPLQCRSFPFWSHILSSRSAWNEQKKNCPGMDRGPLHDPREISAWLQARLNDRLVELSDDDLAGLTEDAALGRGD